MLARETQKQRTVDRMVIEDKFFDLIVDWWMKGKPLPFAHQRFVKKKDGYSFGSDFNQFLFRRLLKRNAPKDGSYPTPSASQKDVEGMQTILNASPEHQYTLFRAWCASAD